MNPEIEKQLMLRVKRADRVIFWCMIGLLMVVVLLFVVIIYQNQRNADADTLRDNDNHKRTQGLIICAAETLQKPIAERGDLNDCIKAAQDRTRDAE